MRFRSLLSQYTLRSVKTITQRRISLRCAMANDLERAPFESIELSLPALGELLRCTPSTLRVLALRATALYNTTDVRRIINSFSNRRLQTWSPATLATLGTIVAGLDYNQLAALPAHALNGLTCGAVENMSPRQVRYCILANASLCYSWTCCLRSKCPTSMATRRCACVRSRWQNCSTEILCTLMWFHPENIPNY